MSRSAGRLLVDVFVFSLIAAILRDAPFWHYLVAAIAVLIAIGNAMWDRVE